MAGFMDANTQFLLRTNLWSRHIKELLLDELNAMKFVRIISDFPDGVTLNIPSIGEAITADFAFIPRQHRALMEAVETDILAKANGGQTAGNANIINLADHRWVGTGASAAIAYPDFARAHYALTKANVPLVNLCAIVDPSVAYTIQTQSNLVNLLSPMPMWENVIRDGAMTGFKFRFNLFGFDIYVSNYLPTIASETITTGGSAGTVTNGVANFFFSAAPGDTLPWVGAFRQLPTVYSEFNKDLQQEEYLTVAEWGFKLYRPENLITILTNTTVVPS